MGGAFWAGIAGAADSVSKTMESDKKREEEMDDYKSKLSFANTLQMQLAEKKMQLAQQYPVYSHFVTSPIDGKVSGFTPTGAMAVLQEGDPEIKKMWEATKQSQIDEKKSKGILDQSTLDVNQARIGAYNAAAGLSSAKAAGGGFAPKGPKDDGISAADFKSRVTSEAFQAHPEAFSKLSSLDQMDPDAVTNQAKARAAALKEAEDNLRSKGIHMKQEGAGSGLLSTAQPSNPFADGDDDDSTNVMNY